MRDFEREETANNQAVDRAEEKIAKQAALVAAMSPDDPLYQDALIVLHEMRHNGASADLIRSLTLYDKNGD